MEPPPEPRTAVQRVIFGLRCRPDARAGWIDPALRAARAIAQSLSYDAVLAPRSPKSAQAIARAIARERKIPLINDDLPPSFDEADLLRSGGRDNRRGFGSVERSGIHRAALPHPHHSRPRGTDGGSRPQSSTHPRCGAPAPRCRSDCTRRHPDPFPRRARSSSGSSDRRAVARLDRHPGARGPVAGLAANAGGGDGPASHPWTRRCGASARSGTRGADRSSPAPRHRRCGRGVARLSVEDAGRRVLHGQRGAGRCDRAHRGEAGRLEGRGNRAVPSAQRGGGAGEAALAKSSHTAYRISSAPTCRWFRRSPSASCPAARPAKAGKARIRGKPRMFPRMTRVDGVYSVVPLLRRTAVKSRSSRKLGAMK